VVVLLVVVLAVVSWSRSFPALGVVVALFWNRSQSSAYTATLLSPGLSDVVFDDVGCSTHVQRDQFSTPHLRPQEVGCTRSGVLLSPEFPDISLRDWRVLRVL
jgi:hypothetical protein